MSVVEGPRSSAGLVARVQNILMKPTTEWDVIAGESATVQSLFMGYAAVLAAIPAIAGVIGQLAFRSVCVFGVCVHLNPIYVVVAAVVRYVLSLVGVYVIGLIIDALAPSFGGEKNQLAAMKVAVYSFTASWLAGIFAVLPALGILGLLGLYSLYLLYLGLPKLMKAPQDKAFGYTAVAVICGIIVFVIATVVAGDIASMGGGAPAVSIG
jgi:hypothetical protein